MVLMGQRRTKQSHNAIAGKLVDRSLVFVNFIHQDLEASVHDLVDFFRVKLLRHGSVIGHICKKNSDEFTFSFNGASGCEDFISQEFGGVGLRLGIINRRGLFSRFQVLTTFFAKPAIRRIRCFAIWA